MRKDDSASKRYFQSDRFFSSNGQWYFTTRENTTAGPFPSRDAAEAGLVEYLRETAGILGRDAWSVPGARR
jgi:hypothetical protein